MNTATMRKPSVTSMMNSFSAELPRKTARQIEPVTFVEVKRNFGSAQLMPGGSSVASTNRD